ncbi:MAG: thioredoxin family protein [Sphingomonas sp.]|uniref:thioredoxin family protein n=1 Tax=Sphingomonas sp. TaxID=28214 RepID=UPI003F8019C4
MRCVVAAAILLAAPCLAADSAAPVAALAHPEARPFGDPDRAGRDVAEALARAKANGHRVILVFGANWCHDSRALAGWFATPRFAAMLGSRYEIVWIDVGQKDRNLDLARRFGLDGIKGTPTVLMLDSTGKPLNLADAPRWHDASTRKEDKIYRYFAR